MMTDPIADMLTRIRNAVRIERTILDMPTSNMRRGIAQVLKDEGYIWDFEEIETVPARTLRLHMKYGPNGERLITRIDRVSKPGRRVYQRLQGAQADPGRHGHPDPEHAPGRHQRPPGPRREGRRRGPGHDPLIEHRHERPAATASGRRTPAASTADQPDHERRDDGSMSRIGRKPVPVPANVKVSIADSTIEVEGPKGKLSFTHRPEIGVELRRGQPSRSWSPASDDERHSRALHGLTRSLVANMVQGVTAGYTKKLEIVGVGYQAQLKKANTVALQVGYANQVVLEAPAGRERDGPRRRPTSRSAAPTSRPSASSPPIVRKVRPPEPYKGKGIRYEGEVVRRKAGKAFGSK